MKKPKPSVPPSAASWASAARLAVRCGLLALAGLFWSLGAAAQPPYRQEILPGVSSLDVDPGSGPVRGCADLDGDGVDELLGGRLADGRFDLFRQRSPTTDVSGLRERRPQREPVRCASPCFRKLDPILADLDADGDLDLASSRSTGSIQYYVNTGGATAPADCHEPALAESFPGGSATPAGEPTWAISTADGDLDLAAISGTDGALATAAIPATRPRPPSWRRPVPPILFRFCRPASRPTSPTSTATATSTWSPATPPGLGLPAQHRHRRGAGVRGRHRQRRPFPPVTVAGQVYPELLRLRPRRRPRRDARQLPGAAWTCSTTPAPSPRPRSCRPAPPIRWPASTRAACWCPTSSTSTATATRTWSLSSTGDVARYFRNTGSAARPAFVDADRQRRSLRHHRRPGQRADRRPGGHRRRRRPRRRGRQLPKLLHRRRDPLPAATSARPPAPFFPVRPRPATFSPAPLAGGCTPGSTRNWAISTSTAISTW